MIYLLQVRSKVHKDSEGVQCESIAIRTFSIKSLGLVHAIETNFQGILSTFSFFSSLMLRIFSQLNYLLP